MWGNIKENIKRQRRKPDFSFLAYHKVTSSPDGLIEEMAEAGYPFDACRGLDTWNLSKMFLFAIPSAARLASADDDTVMCVMDDDDWYGPGYLQQVEEKFRAYPDAWMVGKSDYWARWIGKDKERRYKMNPDMEGPVACVAGPTIAVLWRRYMENPAFRHDPDNYWADTSFIQACHRCGGTIYNTGPGEFYLQRYGDKHGHGWKMPEPA